MSEMKDVTGHTELYGKPAFIFAETMEEEAYEQFSNAMALDCIVKGAVLPDAHVGFDLNIGGVVASDGIVFPSFVGVDIGCGVCALPTTFKKFQVRDNAKSIFNRIYEDIPVGFAHNTEDSEWDYSHLAMSDKLKEIFDKNGLKQLCSAGSGNHYIELGYDEEDAVWITIHSGSRGVGNNIAQHYIKMARDDTRAYHKKGFDVNSQNGLDYIADMKFCLEFALENRRQMLGRIVKAVHKTCAGHADFDNLINRTHNHAELKDGLWIHRKGATHAEAGMLGVIPGNMRDGSFIVEGKGNSNSLFSSSHGAGRTMSRTAARNSITMSDFKKSMDGIQAKVHDGTLDESPFAYKDIWKVMDLQKDLVEVKHYIKPLINIKA